MLIIAVLYTLCLLWMCYYEKFRTFRLLRLQLMLSPYHFMLATWLNSVLLPMAHEDAIQ